MKILIVTGIFEPDIGGPATYVPRLASHLSEAGHFVCVITYASVRNKEEVQYPFVLLRIARGNKLFNRIRMFFGVFARVHRYDVVYLADWFAAGLPAALAARLRGIPYIVRVGGDYLWEQRYLESNQPPVTLREFYEKNLDKKPRYRIYRALIAFVLQSAKHVMFNSDAQRELYETHYALAHTSTIYNPVPKDEVQRIKRGVPSTEFVFWGRFIVMKNLSTLVRAFGKAEISDAFTLILIGDGPRKDEIVSLTRELGLEKRITFLPAMPMREVLERVKDARAFILPSWTDISPNQVYESVALGLPALVTKENYLSIRDQLPDTFDPHSIDVLASKIEMLADDARYSAFVAKFKGISFTQSWDDVILAHERILKSAIEL